jgi:LysM repeat protein
MDTISRENNSMLPVGGIIVGVIALLLGGYAAITLSKVNKQLAEQDVKLAKIDTLESAVNNAAETASKAAKQTTDLRNQTQDGFNQMGGIMTGIQASVTKLEEAAKAKAAAPSGDKGGKNGKKGEAPTAGPGEYVVKSGDTGMKIAQANHVSVSDLQAVNPGVNWSGLKIGQKIKLPSSAAKK